MIDGDRYVFEARMVGLTGQCAMTPLSSNVITSFTNQLLQNESFTATTTIAEGRCGVWDVRIIDSSTGGMVSYAAVTVDNT